MSSLNRIESEIPEEERGKRAMKKARKNMSRQNAKKGAGRECVWEGVWVAGSGARVGMERLMLLAAVPARRSKW